MRIIIITGTPGTGKTSVAKELSSLTNGKILSINRIVLKKKFIESYDQERKTYVVDSEKLISYLREKIKSYIKKNLKILIIEGHYADLVPKNLIEILFILRCDPEILKERLRKKNVMEKSIIENVQAEILGNSVSYALENFGKKHRKKILEIDSSNKNIKEVASLMKKLIFNEKHRKNYYIGKIDWLEELNKKDLIFDYF